MSQQFRGRQVSIAFDEDERHTPFAGDCPQQRRLGCAGRAFQHDVSTGCYRREDEVEFTFPADHFGPDPFPDLVDFTDVLAGRSDGHMMTVPAARQLMAAPASMVNSSPVT